MSDMVRRGHNSIAHRRVSWATRREVGKDLDHVAGRAIVHAAEVEAGAYVAHVGMAYTELLTAQELQAAAMYPERAYRFQAIADAYTGLVVNELRTMTFE